MSLQSLFTVAVGKKPSTNGSVGLLISTKETPEFKPIKTYSLFVVASVQPQESFPSTFEKAVVVGSKSSVLMCASKS